MFSTIVLEQQPQPDSRFIQDHENCGQEKQFVSSYLRRARFSPFSFQNLQTLSRPSHFRYKFK